MRKKEKIDLKGLSNEELLLIFYRFDKYLSTLNNNLDNNRVTKVMNTPYGDATAVVSVPKEQVEKFKKTQYYTLVNSVVDKLKPIVELIEECDPSMKELAKEIK